MSDSYQPYPTPPPSEGYGATVRPEKPASVKTAVNIIWVLVALSVLSTILTFVYLDDIVDGVLAQSGASATTRSAARTGAIGGAILGLVISVVLYVVLAIFLAKGHNWARIVLTVLPRSAWSPGWSAWRPAQASSPHLWSSSR